MSKRFDKEMKRLMKKFDEMFKKMMTSSRKQNLKLDKNSKKFEKEGPGFHMKVEIFNLTTGPDRDTILESRENKKAEDVEEEKEEDKPRKLALKRFKEKNKVAEE
ncbi:hypothetical protein AKJ37_01505 [candidate division MSBL1 archaeon SCGC-AAA259I09]|uniref:Uncharacterized protein n=1 Tax=candidate division MSBL1 archaeon SCGC-AAA259I09 TaxID=1698267 RepID=A0A133UVA3_9EURY|nr:hypothetical protein AKJ37_01505 [candidate division MSBL1 archaeon SCGC-AAA259I09]